MTTHRFAARITLAVVTASVIMLFCGDMALRAWGEREQLSRLQTVVTMLDRQPQWSAQELSQTAWFNGLLQAESIRVLEITAGGHSVYRYPAPDATAIEASWREYRFSLPTHPDTDVRFQVEPVSPLHDSPGALSWLALGAGIILVGQWLFFGWLRKPLRHTDLLIWRARQILEGHYHRALHYQTHYQRPQVAPTDQALRADEWPEPVAGAFDRLLDEVEHLQRERSRFDNFIRSSAFVDPLTGVGNQEYFINRLEVAVRDQTRDSGGHVLLLALTELERIEQQSGSDSSDELMILTSDVLGHLLKRIEAATHARHAHNLFAMLLPHSNAAEAAELARQLLRTLRRLQLPSYVDSDSFFYIGGAGYQPQEPVDQLLESAEQALRIAKLQGPSGWYFHDSQKAPAGESSRGSVRWRLLLERVFEQRRIAIFYQPVVDMRSQAKWYLELLPRIEDEQGRSLSANTFLPMVDKVGMLQRLDRYMVSELICRLRGGSKFSLSVNLSLASLEDQSTRTWLSHELMQLPLRLRRKIVFEMAEEIISGHLHAVQQTLQLLKGMGCRVAVDNAGKNVVSTQYVHDLKLDYLKVHPSLVRDLQLRPVNQLALRSLMGGCANSATRLVAVGVETEEEWRMLKQLGVDAAQGFYFSEPRNISLSRRRQHTIK